MDEEDLYGDEDFNNEDSSWKVRKAAIGLLDGNLNSISTDVCSECLKSCFPTLLKLVLFKDDNVQKDLFFMYIEVVQTLQNVKGFNIQANLTALVKNICKFYSKCENDEVKCASVEV
jgi:hypothetical protein